MRKSYLKEEFCIKDIAIKELKPIPLPRPFYDATMAPFEHYNYASLILTDTEGNQGEVPLPVNCVWALENVLIKAIRQHKKLIKYADLYDKLYWSIRNEGHRGNAAAALGFLDLAFWDLAAKRKEVSMHRFLGGESDKVPVYASGGSLHLSIRELADECRSYVDQGYQLIKIKIGAEKGNDLEKDLKRIREVRKAIGDHVELAIDGNQVYNVDQAVKLSERASEMNIAWFEEPVHAAALHKIEMLCQNSSIPVAYGESERSSEVFPALLKAGVSYLQPIAGYLTLSDFLEVGDLAHQKTTPLACGGISQMHCQITAAITEHSWQEYLIPVLGVLDNIFKVKPKIEDGMYILPDVPGFCIQVDWDKMNDQQQVKNEQVWKI